MPVPYNLVRVMYVLNAEIALVTGTAAFNAVRLLFVKVQYNSAYPWQSQQVLDPLFIRKNEQFYGN